VDHRSSGPRWTGRGRLTGVWPPATPGLEVAGEGAGEVEEAAVSTFVGSLELGRRGNGGAAGLKNRRRSGSVGARSGAGEEEERAR
jgi:hypothetical protein